MSTRKGGSARSASNVVASDRPVCSRAAAVRYTRSVNRRDFLSDVAALAAAGAAPFPQATRPPDRGAGSLTDVPGVRVGHFTDTRRPTGCTAILFDPAAAAGVDYDGSAPGESQGILLQPVSSIIAFTRSF